MINNHFSTVFAVLAVLATQAHAAEQTAVVSPGIASAGERDFGAKLLVCGTCHGARGLPQNPTIPVIWGQQENYLQKQLHDFERGDRTSEAMAWMASTLSQSQMVSAAAYFANKNWPSRSPGGTSASPPALAAVCQVCHQQNFAGGLPAPRLAGQSYEYLIEAMRRYADGERTNSSDMTNIMKALSSSEREAMARYIAGL